MNTVILYSVQSLRRATQHYHEGRSLWLRKAPGIKAVGVSAAEKKHDGFVQSGSFHQKAFVQCLRNFRNWRWRHILQAMGATAGVDNRSKWIYNFRETLALFIYGERNLIMHTQMISASLIVDNYNITVHGKLKKGIRRKINVVTRNAT